MTIRHLLSADDLDLDELTRLFDLTDRMAEVSARAIPRIPALRGKTVASAFFEDSTRTRLSFDTAAKRLSADVLSFAAGSSSVKKGESIRDTIETISAMGVDAFVVRHAGSGVPQQITQWTDAAVINAGDGWHQHPTQGLIDGYTALRALSDLRGRRVVMVGDIVHSRVARSTTRIFQLLGADVVWVAPLTLLPASLTPFGVRASENFDAELAEADICYVLRIQSERIGEALFPSISEYQARFGFTARRAANVFRGEVLMHPGPMIRGVEIEGDAADDPRSVVTTQVANGVAIRMAVLFSVLGAHPDVDTNELA